jgi:Rieske Fe-S protein
VSTPTELSGCADSCPTRRAALVFGATAGAAALLTGCATYGGSADAGAADVDASADEPDPAASADAEESGGAKSGGAASGAAVLAKTADIPVGGGKIFAKKGVVVTQPTEGTFKAFSTVCTHQGCAVEKIEDGTINCLCHGSKFKIADGSVADGPAPKPLPAKKITVDGDSLKLA